MELFPDSKIIISIGGLSITWYAFFIVTGALIAYYLTRKTFRKWGYKDEILENFFLTLMPLVIIGARLWYVIFEWKHYANNIISIFYVWEGGLAIHGGIIVGIIYGSIYFYRHKINVLRMADVIFPNLMLAQAIGRWGNFMNQEAFGGIVPESFYQHWPSFIKNQMYIDGAYHQPTFLFESVGNIIGFILITFVYKKYGRKKRGDLAFAYFAWYGTLRFIIESMRTDSLYTFGGLRIAQIVSVIGIVIGVLGILGVWNKLFKNFFLFKKQKPVVLFDMDGTLLDTDHLIFESYKHAFAIYKPEYVLSDEELESFVGPTLEQSFEKYFPKDMTNELVACYRDFNHDQHDHYAKEIDGVKETLEFLHANGYKLGVVSNKNKLAIEKGLELMDMQDKVDTIISCEEIKHPKPNPEGLLKACEEIGQGHDDVIYVGDTPTDIQAAKNMAAFSIAFILDNNRLESMEQEKPLKIIYNMNELMNIVKEDIEWSDNSI